MVLDFTDIRAHTYLRVGASGSTMLIPAITAFFRYKVVRSIIVLACWRPFEQNQFIREISEQGFAATFACNPAALDDIHRYGLQGVLYFKQSDDSVLKALKSDHFCGRYAWLVVGDSVPAALDGVRYDAEVALLRTVAPGNDTFGAIVSNETVHFEDIYVHLSAGATAHPWGRWSRATGLQLVHERERILRRFDFKGYPMRIAAPLGQYSDEWYNGSYADYVVDETLTELDAGIRCGYAASALVIQLLNATEVLITTELWGATIHNNSMPVMLAYGSAELSGGILRILLERIEKLDYIMPIWPFNVGFTYLAERESSSNMFIEPFTAGVWWTCLGIVLVLAAALRITARSQEEKDDSYCAVWATFLQQDASAVPKGLSGRWTFMVLSVCAMLVHAYYTSAIVSALMSAGSGGPDSLRSLADSKYAIASEDYSYMRYLFFDVETTWDDLEYLKKKKKTSKFYQVLERGVKLIEDGSTAFHTEYNQIYPHFKTFSDDQICKLQHVDTIPEVLTWITATHFGQFTNTFRAAGGWLSEVGLGRRLVSSLQAQKPSCRAQMLAERVKFGDVALLMGLTVFGGVLSLVILGLEILVARYGKCGRGKRLLSDGGSIDTETFDVEK